MSSKATLDCYKSFLNSPNVILSWNKDKETIELQEEPDSITPDECCKVDEVTLLLDADPKFGRSNTHQFYKKAVSFFIPNLRVLHQWKATLQQAWKFNGGKKEVRKGAEDGAEDGAELHLCRCNPVFFATNLIDLWQKYMEGIGVRKPLLFFRARLFEGQVSPPKDLRDIMASQIRRRLYSQVCNCGIAY